MLGGTAKRRLDILEAADGAYHFKYKGFDEDGEPLLLKRLLDQGAVVKIKTLMSKAVIPAFPEHVFGCDGCYTELEVGKWGGCESYKWWSEKPEGWEPLGEIVDYILVATGVDEM
jgi:hypothetical protein